MISKGQRVEHKVNGKIGTTTDAEYVAIDGQTRTYVKWDGSKRPATRILVSNLKAADA